MDQNCIQRLEKDSNQILEHATKKAMKISDEAENVLPPFSPLKGLPEYPTGTPTAFKPFIGTYRHGRGSLITELITHCSFFVFR